MQSSSSRQFDPLRDWKKVSWGRIQNKSVVIAVNNITRLMEMFFRAAAGTAPPLSQREHIQLWHHRRHHNKLDGLVLPNDVYHLMCTRWDLITFPPARCEAKCLSSSRGEGEGAGVEPKSTGPATPPMASWEDGEASFNSGGKERTFFLFQTIKDPHNEK